MIWCAATPKARSKERENTQYVATSCHVEIRRSFAILPGGVFLCSICVYLTRAGISRVFLFL